MSTQSVPVVGIPWYRLDRYKEICAVMVDGASFPKTHASWRQKAGRMERELKRQANQPVRVDMDPAVFADWCSDRELLPDSAARAQFVAEAVATGRYKPPLVPGAAGDPDV